MQKFLAYATIFVLICFPAFASDLLIYEVLYDPVGSDTGKEWVVLYNSRSFPVMLTNYTLESGNGAEEGDWTVEWSGNATIMQPHSFFLIGEESVIPAPDFITSLDLQQGPDSVRIRRNDEVIDTLGWGEHTFPEYYEGTSANLTLQGQSLQRLRLTDTNNNALDFHAVDDPIPLSQESGTDPSLITVSVNVLDTTPSILAWTMEDDLPAAGHQIFPEPGDEKLLHYSARLGHPYPITGIALYLEHEGSEALSFDETEISEYETNISSVFPLEFYDDPGNYSIILSFEDTFGDSFEYTFEFEVQELLAYSLDAYEVTFESMQPGSASIVLGDGDFNNSRPTLRNLGNSPLDVKISGLDLISNNSRINVSNIEYSFSGEFTGPLYGTLTSALQHVPLNLAPGILSVNPLSIKLTIPGDVQAGFYQSNITILGSSG